MLDDQSDVDALIVVADAAFPSYTHATEWLHALGPLYAVHQPEGGTTTRAVFADGVRAGLLVQPERGLEPIAARCQRLIAEGFRPVFSRSSALGRVLARQYPRSKPTYPSDEQFRALANDFRFKANRSPDPAR